MRPATSAPGCAASALVYQGLALLLGVATLGVGWVYCVGAALGAARRTLYDEWSRVILLQRAGPRPARRIW